jgi:hypothetical protein
MMNDIWPEHVGVRGQQPNLKVEHVDPDQVPRRSTRSTGPVGGRLHAPGSAKRQQRTDGTSQQRTDGTNQQSADEH